MKTINGKTFRACRWRKWVEPDEYARATCTSAKVGPHKPFHPEAVCSGCILIDHEPLTEEELTRRKDLRQARTTRNGSGKCCDEPDFSPITLPVDYMATAKPLSIQRYDETNLFPDVKGQRGNASLIRFQGRSLLAWRHTPPKTKGSSIVLTEVLGEGIAGRSWRLALNHSLCKYGQEDPRLFIFRGDLHISFTGVAGTSVCVLYAQLLERDGEWTVNRVWYPDFHDREPKEKNWGFFDVAGNLHVVYSLNPLVVLHVDGSNIELVTKHDWQSPWQAGLMRGGAAPVLVKDEWYAFFHGVDAQRTYTVGVMTFDGSMRPRRCSRWPIIVPDHATRPATEPNSAWYVCGATLIGDEWIVSGGVHNSWIEVRRYKAADVEHSLEAVP